MIRGLRCKLFGHGRHWHELTAQEARDTLPHFATVRPREVPIGPGSGHCHRCGVIRICGYIAKVTEGDE